MKYEELKPYLVGYERQYYVYDATSVEEAIAELKAKLAEKDKEIESLKASHYAEMVDANMRKRRLGGEHVLALMGITLKVRMVA